MVITMRTPCRPFLEHIKKSSKTSHQSDPKSDPFPSKSVAGGYHDRSRQTRRTNTPKMLPPGAHGAPQWHPVGSKTPPKIDEKTTPGPRGYPGGCRGYPPDPKSHENLRTNNKNMPPLLGKIAIVAPFKAPETRCFQNIADQMQPTLRNLL